MNPKLLFAMIGRKSLTIVGAFLAGVWCAFTFPIGTKAAMESLTGTSTVGGIGGLIAIGISIYMSLQNTRASSDAAATVQAVADSPIATRLTVALKQEEQTGVKP